MSWPQPHSRKIDVGCSEGVGRKEPREDPAPAVGWGGQEGAPRDPRCLVPGIDAGTQEEEWGRVGGPGA